MIRRFLIVWVIYWSLFAIMPLVATEGSLLAAIMLQLFFVLVVFASSLAAKHVLQPVTFIRYPNKNQILLQRNIVLLSIFVSVIGLMLLTYDKISVQGIDYSRGFARARQQWKALGDDRGGAVSSAYSAAGYLIGSSYYLGAILLVSRRTFFKDSFRFFSLLIIFLLTVLNSMITGGRSSILLMLVFLCSSYFLNQSKERKTLFYRSRYFFGVTLLLAIAFVYVALIFVWRSEASNSLIEDYALNFFPFLNLKPTNTYYYIIEHSVFADVFSALSLCVAYLSHSLVTTSLIINTYETGGVVIMGHIYNLLVKLGYFESSDRDWFLAGRFPSLPGGLYYHSGLVGVFIMAIILGIFSGLIERITFKYINSSLALIFYCATEAILLLSPLLFAGDFLSFPFVITGGLICVCFLKLMEKWKSIHLTIN